MWITHIASLFPAQVVPGNHLGRTKECSSTFYWCTTVPGTPPNSVVSKTELVALYPTVVQQNYTIAYNLPDAGTATLTVYDVLGRLITQSSTIESQGSHQSVFSVDGLKKWVILFKIPVGYSLRNKAVHSSTLIPVR